MSRFGDKFSIVDAAFDLTSGPGPCEGLAASIPMSGDTRSICAAHISQQVFTPMLLRRTESKFISGAQHWGGNLP